VDIAYLVAPWFLFIIVFCDIKHLPHAAILFIMATVNILFVDVFGMTNPLSYVEEKYLLMWYDLSIALFMITILLVDKQAWKHALILAFAAMCHFMIIYDLTVYSSFVTNLFYAWYDELIITVGMLQMAISYNVFSNSLRGMRRFISGCTNNIRDRSQGLYPSERGGKRS
ncbi:MAG: hypothetical protein COA78_21005, partial [Blastopirellula sp.]